jgi:hypothetical protein
VGVRSRPLPDRLGNRVAAMYNWARALTFSKNRPYRTITAERVRYELTHHTEAEP